MRSLKTGIAFITGLAVAQEEPAALIQSQVHSHPKVLNHVHLEWHVSHAEEGSKISISLGDNCTVRIWGLAPKAGNRHGTCTLPKGFTKDIEMTLEDLRQPLNATSTVSAMYKQREFGTTHHTMSCPVCGGATCEIRNDLLPGAKDKKKFVMPQCKGGRSQTFVLPAIDLVELSSVEKVIQSGIAVSRANGNNGLKMNLTMDSTKVH